MTLVASFPGGLRLIGARRMILTALAFCLAPAVAGAAGLLVVNMFGAKALGEVYLPLWGISTFGLVSPFVVTPIWIVIAAGAAFLLHRNLFGLLPAALLGTLGFAALVTTDLGLIALPFGTVSGLCFRMALALQRPEAF